ncbi:hypothetical protein ACFO1B_36950 [Dactylosporangium siamense]|nr:hypothetical protein [Dactylosporangium siamense]
MAGAAAAFGVLLDRLVTRIGELAADARRFDREEMATLADVWDRRARTLATADGTGLSPLPGGGDDQHRQEPGRLRLRLATMRTGVRGDLPRGLLP